MKDLRSAVEGLPYIEGGGKSIKRAAVLDLIPEDALLVTIDSLTKALHDSDAGGICPTEDCDFHYQMARAALERL